MINEEAIRILKNAPIMEVNYEVNIGGSVTFGILFMPDNATEEDIKLAIIDDLYSVEYKITQMRETGRVNE